MKIVISGGNSGIGLEAARQLVGLGHHCVLLGRDATKGAAALASLQAGPGSAEFHAVDLSTHAGVRAAAEKIKAAHPRIDALILGAGVLMLRDARTADGLHPILAVNYLSRYHLAQLLLPEVRAAAGSIVLVVAGVPLDSAIDFARFPKFDAFPGVRGLSSVQIANYHYVAHLARAEPTVRAAAANVGLVSTEIMREMPLVIRLAFPIVGLVANIPVERAAHNAVWLATHQGWPSGRYWKKPGQHELSEALPFDPAVTERVVSVSRELTGA